MNHLMKKHLKKNQTKKITYPNNCLATANIVDVFPVPGGP